MSSSPGPRSLPRTLDCAGRPLRLDRPRVMGIVNVTPDSFSDGGLFLSPAAAVGQGIELVAAGADLLDIGGESTRPGAAPVAVEEELDRVIPVIEALHEAVEVPLSIDTSKPQVMRAAVAAGAGLINDVSALRAEGALTAVAELEVPVCLMHMQGEPRTMQQAPHYADVVADVSRFLLARRDACLDAGIMAERILLDPGFGFGKTLEHNLTLFRALAELVALGPPLVVGVSRKSMLGQLLGAPPAQRVHGSVALALLAAQQGASILRVHDVLPTVQALAVLRAVYGGG